MEKLIGVTVPRLHFKRSHMEIIGRMKRRKEERKIAKRFYKEFGRVPTKEELKEVTEAWDEFKKLHHHHQCVKCQKFESCTSIYCSRNAPEKIICNNCANDT